MFVVNPENEDITQMARVNHSIRDHTPNVANQKDEHYCMMMTFADMVGTTLSMYKGKRIVLSPQVLIEHNIHDVEELCKILTDPNRGLERVRNFPFTRMVDLSLPPGECDYQRQKRYWINEIKVHMTPISIRVALSNNFDTENGYQYPCLGVIRMSNFADADVAKLNAEAGEFYSEQRPPNFREIKVDAWGVPHSLLITGINTISRDRRMHYCEVKNTHGYRWGDGGFSNVSIDLFDYILVPRHGHMG